VRAFNVTGAPGAPLTRVPARAFSLLAEPNTDATGLHAPMPVPVRLVRANKPVRWVASATALGVDLEERAPPGAVAAGTLAVTDADAEQDVAFSVLNVSLAGCAWRSGNFSGTANSFAVPAGLFSLLTEPNSTLIRDAATGVSQTVNSTRSLRVVVGVDALDIDEPAAACGIPPEQLSSCHFSLALMASDSGDPSRSHSLLPRQNATSAVTVVSARVARSALYAPPAVTAVEGLPPAGLSAGGGDTVDFVGTGLGLPIGPTANAMLVLRNAGGETFNSTNCAVVTRLTRVRCVTPAGSGGTLQLSLLWASAVRGVVAAPLALGYAQPTVEAAVARVSPLVVANNAMMGTGNGSFLVVLTNGPPVPPPQQLVLHRARGVWGAPLFSNATCSVASTGERDALLSGRAWRGASALACAAAPGVGGASAIDTAGSAATSPARLSFPPPRVTAVLQDCASHAGCARLGTFLLRGDNFGNAAPASACGGGACAVALDNATAVRRARFLQGFDLVQ